MRLHWAGHCQRGHGSQVSLGGGGGGGGGLGERGGGGGHVEPGRRCVRLHSAGHRQWGHGSQVSGTTGLVRHSSQGTSASLGQVSFHILHSAPTKGIHRAPQCTILTPPSPLLASTLCVTAPEDSKGRQLGFGITVEGSSTGCNDMLKSICNESGRTDCQMFV